MTLSSLITLTVLWGWTASIFITFKRFADYPRGQVALLSVWFLGLSTVLADMSSMQEALPVNIVLSMQALGKPVLVGLTLSALFGMWVRQRFYVLIIRWSIIGLIGIYVTLEVINNDLLQRDIATAYVGVLLSYACTGVATWQLTRIALADLSAPRS